MEGFNPNARKAILWTRSQLSIDERRWLGTPQLRMSLPGMPITLVHATLDSPNTWGYVFDVYHAIDNFSYQLTQLCFCHAVVSLSHLILRAASGAGRQGCEKF